MPPSLYPAILARLTRSLKNVDNPHPRVAVCFSGIPGSGKTTLGKFLEKNYEGVRVNTDELREIIAQFIPGTDQRAKIQRERVLGGFMTRFLHSYPFRNGRLIVDASMDRSHEKMMPLFRQNGFRPFVVRINTPTYLAIHRIDTKRKNKEFFQQFLEKWARDFERSKVLLSADLSLDSTKPRRKLRETLGKAVENQLQLSRRPRRQQ